MDYNEWKLTQDISGWELKYYRKTNHAKSVGLKNLLTFEEYLYKAFEAKIESYKDVNRSKFHLCRINDEGDYTVSTCRFRTAQENRQESDYSYMSSNIISRGSNNGSTHLTDSDVIEIYNSPLTYSELAYRFNVSNTAIGAIKRKVTWTHLTKDFPNNKPLRIRK